MAGGVRFGPEGTSAGTQVALRRGRGPTGPLNRFTCVVTESVDVCVGEGQGRTHQKYRWSDHPFPPLVGLKRTREGGSSTSPLLPPGLPQRRPENETLHCQTSCPPHQGEPQPCQGEREGVVPPPHGRGRVPTLSAHKLHEVHKVPVEIGEDVEVRGKLDGPVPSVQKHLVPLQGEEPPAVDP